MKTPSRVLLPALALGLWVVPASAQEDPKPEPEVVPAIPLIQPGAAKPQKAVRAMPMVQPGAAQTQGAAATSGAEAYEALERDFADTYRGWMSTVQELRGTGEEYPPAPHADFYGRFRALADTGSVDARMWCLQNFAAGDTTPAEFRAMAWKGEAIGLATAARGNTELAKRLLRAVGAGQAIDGVGREGVTKVLAYMTATSGAPIRAAILAYRASTAEWDRDPEIRATAAGLYQELLERYPDSSEAARATGKLFAAQNLAVGKTPPDFTGTDVDGETINLYDYRGKVVVVDFWGFW